MNFQQTLNADMENVFCNTDEFGELVKYKPLNKPILSVSALVIRNPPEKVGVMPRFQVNQVQVSISRDSLPDRPVLDGDTVMLAGGTKWLTVVKLYDESDPGAWHLLVS